MDQRQARRLIARWAAAACRSLSGDEFEDYTPADRRRLLKARDDLVAELDVRAGAPRQRRAAPTDPDQIALWEQT